MPWPLTTSIVCGPDLDSESRDDAEGLVDEVILKVNPVMVGAGIPLVTRDAGDITLEMIDTRVYGNGVVVIRHRVKSRGRGA